MNICVHQGEKTKQEQKLMRFSNVFLFFFLPLLFRSMPETTGRWLLYPAGLSVSPEACCPRALPAGFPDSRGHLHFSR